MWRQKCDLSEKISMKVSIEHLLPPVLFPENGKKFYWRKVWFWQRWSGTKGCWKEGAQSKIRWMIWKTISRNVRHYSLTGRKKKQRNGPLNAFWSVTLTQVRINVAFSLKWIVLWAFCLLMYRLSRSQRNRINRGNILGSPTVFSVVTWRMERPKDRQREREGHLIITDWSALIISMQKSVRVIIRSEMITSFRSQTTLTTEPTPSISARIIGT